MIESKVPMSPGWAIVPFRTSNPCSRAICTAPGEGSIPTTS
ncbi:hypothetical protein HNR21_001147 [Actinomadura cellulosilytica]|uniref:Uncharacterized protein n=1 Tax=Thermomonospora cellulosilytica TaxID=1411118 RepID=A0A7W3R7F0_9ACTN|nr:hypothetical protein [Thermomonospora cellulosilytica]MBA9002265.1 hypothetical protein [Thermomonospora cellulosilytica]